MALLEKQPKILNDRIRLPFNFDVAKMQEEVEKLNFNNFIHYDAYPLRAPAHMIDPSIPFPPPAEDFADGSWTEWLDSSALKKSPYLTEVVNTFREHTKVNLVRLLRLAPQGTIKEHTDPTLGLHIEKSVIRLTIPIITNNAVEFILNGETVPMKLGECWYLRLTDPHKVNNLGKTARINMTIDMIPNEWIRSLIVEATK